MDEPLAKSDNNAAAPGNNGTAVSNGDISQEEIRHITEELYKRNLELANLYKERELLNKQLEDVNEKLKSLDKLKTEFLSLASHQLRSPLTAIKGYVSMLLEGSFGDISENQREVVNKVFISSKHLTRIIEDLLDVSKIEQGGMQYAKTDFSLAKIAGEITEEFEINAQSKGLELSFEKPANMENYKINGDSEKIRQVIINTIDNSIKYTEKGWIKVKIEKKNGNVILSISDSGMGMNEEAKQKLFQKFSRGDGDKVNVSGSGLGLYLAKKIIEDHGGKIWVESSGAGQGSTFFVQLKASQ